MAKATTGNFEFLKVQDVDLEVERRGAGAPLVLLDDEEGLTREAAFVDDLAKSHEVIIPSAPGFGHSSRPDWIETMDDIAYIMLDFLDQAGIEDATVLGFSLGGWIAAEMAVKNVARIGRLALVDPYGIKVGGPWDRDIQDIWFLPKDEVQALKYADASNGDIDYTEMPDEKLEVVARNRESFARFCWRPYMHNPKLKRRLHRITVPTLVIWGADDGVVTTDYGKAFADEIPGARFEVIEGGGHFPHLEQPAAFMDVLGGFLAGSQKAA
ncbi:MAG: alpha/beta hydrolase [Alphaproteobacteria bacterium]|nr:alpha/beta hydrolase [Alphaproteobacteria bacterium]